MLRLRLEHVRERIRRACQRCDRQPSSVVLVGVTKGVAADAIQEALALGLTDIGENRVQEALAKQQELQRLFGVQGAGFRVNAPNPQPRTQNALAVKWHLIGHLQRNKAKLAAGMFDAIHSVDSVELIQVLERARAAMNLPPLEALVQVNVSGEASKSGCRPEEVLTLARAVAASPHLRFGGFMTIPPFAQDPEQVRPHFRRLRELRDEVALASNLPGPPSTLSWPGRANLSMGMSGDFEVAIEEGADYIRVGTAIFGSRNQHNSEFGMRSAE